jgi:lipopolysaccharide exporter
MKPGHVADRSIGAAGWMAAGTVVRAGLQITVQVTFARTLGPDLMGVFILGSAAVSLCTLVADMGVSYRLIQQTEVDPTDIRLAFTWHVLTAFLTALLLMAASHSLAVWFAEPRLSDVIPPLAAVIIFAGASATGINLLKRDLNFKVIQISLLCSYVIGYLFIGVPALILGAGLWAPIMAWVVQSAIHAILVYAYRPHPVKPLFTSGSAPSAVQYSATFFLTNITNWLITNMDRLVLGRLSGVGAVGVYATPYNLLQNVTLQFTNTTQPILFSAAARFESDKPAMARAYKAVLAGAVIFIFPLFVGVAAAAPTLIEFLYGESWAAAGKIATPLALAMPVYIVWTLSTPILWNTNQRTKEFKYQLPLLPLWVLMISLAALSGPLAVAWCLVALQLLRAGITTAPAIRVLGVKPLEFFNVLKVGAVISVLIGGALLLIETMLRGEGYSVLTRLTADALVGAALFVFLLRTLYRLMNRDLADLIQRTLLRLPPTLSRLIKCVLFPSVKA